MGLSLTQLEALGECRPPWQRHPELSGCITTLTEVANFCAAMDTLIDQDVAEADHCSHIVHCKNVNPKGSASLPDDYLHHNLIMIAILYYGCLYPLTKDITHNVAI